MYQEIRKFRAKLKQLSKKKFPKDEQYVLRPQLWGVLDPILLNIAQGKDLYRQLKAFSSKVRHS